MNSEELGKLAKKEKVEDFATLLEAEAGLRDPPQARAKAGLDDRRGHARGAARRLRLPAQPRVLVPRLARRRLRQPVADPPVRPAKVGHVVVRAIRPPKETETYFALLRVEEVNGEATRRNCSTTCRLREPHAAAPERAFPWRRPATTATSRRGSSTSSPRSASVSARSSSPRREPARRSSCSRSTNAIATNHDDVHVIVLLIDERPEEVTDFRATPPENVEVVASTFDEKASRHIQVCRDGASRRRAHGRVRPARRHPARLDHPLARGYNNAMPNTGKIGTGGVDTNALIKPKKFFGAARNIEDGGSLTIIATALVDTGSRRPTRSSSRSSRAPATPSCTSTAAGREAGLPRDRHRRLGHPSRGTAAGSQGARADRPPPQGRLGHERRRGDGAAPITPEQDQEQRRVPHDDERWGESTEPLRRNAGSAAGPRVLAERAGSIRVWLPEILRRDGRAADPTPGTIRVSPMFPSGEGADVRHNRDLHPVQPPWPPRSRAGASPRTEIDSRSSGSIIVPRCIAVHPSPRRLDGSARSDSRRRARTTSRQINVASRS